LARSRLGRVPSVGGTMESHPVVGWDRESVRGRSSFVLGTRWFGLRRETPKGRVRLTDLKTTSLLQRSRPDSLPSRVIPQLARETSSDTSRHPSSSLPTRSLHHVDVRARADREACSSSLFDPFGRVPVLASVQEPDVLQRGRPHHPRPVRSQQAPPARGDSVERGQSLCA
jgi:hypothetical protein